MGDDMFQDKKKDRKGSCIKKDVYVEKSKTNSLR